jgi:hypothetical protein
MKAGRSIAPALGNLGNAMYKQTVRGLVVAIAVALAGCGGGGDGGSADVVIVGGAPVLRLDIALSRPTPEAIQLDWSDDSYVDSYVVTRDGYTLAEAVTTTTLIDASVIFNVQYCYQVLGYDFNGQLISATDVACVVV